MKEEKRVKQLFSALMISVVLMGVVVNLNSTDTNVKTTSQEQEPDDVIYSISSPGCEDIPISGKQFIVELKAKGPSGELKMPALLDTGASMTVIPERIAEGIGYSESKSRDFRTVGGSTNMEIIKLDKISFLGFNFENTKVAIEKKSEANYSRYVNINGKRQKTELAIIGMSELMKTNFSYKKNVLTVCR